MSILQRAMTRFAIQIQPHLVADNSEDDLLSSLKAALESLSGDSDSQDHKRPRRREIPQSP